MFFANRKECAMEDGLLQRLYIKSLGNEIAIAVGSSSSEEVISIPSLAERIRAQFHVDYEVNHRLQFFQKWNEFIIETEKIVTRQELTEFVHEIAARSNPSKIHNQIASIPISNFIDTTFDRSLYKALTQAGRTPILHDWNRQMIGSWKQSNPECPNIFFMLPNVADHSSFFGIYEPAGWSKQNRIQLENMREMLSGKDLILLDISHFEAEGVLHLYYIDTACEKVVNFATRIDTEFDGYWTKRGAYMIDTGPGAILQRLSPRSGVGYGMLDMLFPSRRMIDVSRKKQYDCFISYFSGDKDFVIRLEQSLRLREVHTWRDDREIEIGDSISDRIQEGLSQSYSFMIVLSPEALLRPWVKEELRAAYSLRLGGEFKIVPVLHKECEIPPFLADYKYADFRDERRYEEQIGLLERAIKNAVKRAREKR